MMVLISLWFLVPLGPAYYITYRVQADCPPPFKKYLKLFNKQASGICAISSGAYLFANTTKKLEEIVWKLEEIVHQP